MIERLVIHRFRGIREGVLDDLGTINLLIGPNNSGKTAILELLYLTGLSGRPCDLVMPDMEPSAWPAKTLVPYDFLGYEPLPNLRARHGESKRWPESPAGITVEHGLAVTLGKVSKGYPLHRFELAPPLDEPGRRRAFQEEDIERISLFRLEPLEDNLPPAPLIPPLFDERDIRLEEGAWHYLWEDPWVYKWDRREDIDHLAVWAVAGRMPDAGRVLLFDFHTTGGHFTERFADNAYKTLVGWEKKIAQSLGRVFPELRGVDIAVRPLRGEAWTGYVEWPDREPISIDHFGDGARHAFKVLAGLIALCETVDEEHPGLFLWEDPELFMHPASLNRLLGEVVALVQGKPIQVFLSSQSIEVIALLTHRLQSVEKPDYRAFRLDLEEGRLYVAKYHHSNILAWLKAGMDMRFWNVTDLPISYCYQASEESSQEDL